MGDAGSIFIGFTVIWLLIEATQGENNTYIRPVTALWVIAIPLMDMATIMSPASVKVNHRSSLIVSTFIIFVSVLGFHQVCRCS